MTEVHDAVNHPKHYTSSGIKCAACGHDIEAIEITENFGFSLGNAIKYIWRAKLKNGLEDLKKARWYINREVERQEQELTKHIAAGVRPTGYMDPDVVGDIPASPKVS